MLRWDTVTLGLLLYSMVLLQRIVVLLHRDAVAKKFCIGSLVSCGEFTLVRMSTQNSQEKFINYPGLQREIELACMLHSGYTVHGETSFCRTRLHVYSVKYAVVRLHQQT